MLYAALAIKQFCLKRSTRRAQTLASQGIIHGGLSALQGALSSAAQAIADMPSRWRPVSMVVELDLRGCRF